MTTLNAATIASMTRTAIWAYITDNNLPVAKKRSTQDARQELTTYMESVAAIEPTEEPTTTIEQPAIEPEQPAIEQPTATIEPTETLTEIEPVSRIGASIVLVAIITAIWVVFTQLLVPAAIGIVNLAMILYRQATSAILRWRGYANGEPTCAIEEPTSAIGYLPDPA